MSVILFIVIRIKNRRVGRLILCDLHTITLGTMLNNNGGNNGHGLKNVTCKQTFTFQITAFFVFVNYRALYAVS